MLYFSYGGKLLGISTDSPLFVSLYSFWSVLLHVGNLFVRLLQDDSVYFSLGEYYLLYPGEANCDKGIYIKALIRNCRVVGIGKLA